MSAHGSNINKFYILHSKFPSSSHFRGLLIISCYYKTFSILISTKINHHQEWRTKIELDNEIKKIEWVSMKKNPRHIFLNFLFGTWKLLLLPLKQTLSHTQEFFICIWVFVHSFSNWIINMSNTIESHSLSKIII
jgi:hypothetical protein